MNWGGTMIFPWRRNFDMAPDPYAALNALGFARGKWTPTLTFATPGDLSVTYIARLGYHAKIDNIIHIWFVAAASAFTHTTASGALQITGLPFTQNSGISAWGTVAWGGITKANYTHVTPRIASGTAIIDFLISGSGQSLASVTTADVPTAQAKNFQGHIAYFM